MAVLKRTTVALASGAPRRALGCFNGFSGRSSLSGCADVGGAGACALLVVAALPLQPDPGLPEREARTTAMTVTPFTFGRLARDASESACSPCSFRGWSRVGLGGSR